MNEYKVYKRNVIGELKAFSDRSFQEIAWFENDQGLSTSFNATASDLFDDFFLEKALYDKDVIVFSTAADQALRCLNDAVDAVGYDRLDTELINAPDMQIVREKAAIALALVIASDGSESTEEIIEE